MFEFAVFEFLMIRDRRKNGLKRLPACGTIAAHLLREDLGTSRSRAAKFTVHDLRLAGKSTTIVRRASYPLVSKALTKLVQTLRQEALRSSQRVKGGKIRPSKCLPTCASKLTQRVYEYTP